ncbi:MAG: 2-hydroxyacyl-CoA dehydratase, partial [Candidatus Heimdallarchaeota archaeon]
FPDNPNGLTLSNSIKLYNIKRAFLQKLSSLVSERKLEYQEFAKLILLADIIPIETANEYLELKIEHLESSISKSLPDTPRLLLTGGMFDSYRLFEAVPEFNYLVADDLSFGTRNFNFTVPQSRFLEGYAKAYLERTPDPTAFDMSKRLNGIKSQIKHHRIDGVVLLGVKWCDPDTFEFVPIQNALKDLDIPYLNIETTPDLSNQQQIQTRLTAFIEMIS